MTNNVQAKFQVKIMPTAQKDLRKAMEYIAHDNPNNALKFVSDVRTKINNVLANSPQICLPPRAYPLLAEQGYKRLSVHINYSVLWLWNGDVIEVQRILHNKRNWTLIIGGSNDTSDE